MSVSGEGPGAREQRRNRIVTWHACGHDQLDLYGVPRMADGLEFTLAERIGFLAEMGGVPKAPRRTDGITPSSTNERGPS